jgi:MFS family permease
VGHSGAYAIAELAGVVPPAVVSEVGHRAGRRRVAMARVAVSTAFFLNGFGFANWVVRIPAVQRQLELSPGLLGLALLGPAFGGLLTMPLAGSVVARRGSRPVTRVAALAYAAALLLPPMAPSFALLVAALVVLGAVNGALGVSMVAQSVTLQRFYGRPITTSFHAFFSFGGLAGAVAGGAIAGAGLGPVAHLAIVAGMVGVLALATGPALLPATVDAAPEGSSFARPTRALLALGTIAFCILVGEGAMADWTAVYLRDVSGASPAMAAAGFAAFSLMMTAGRVVGDRLTARVGADRLGRVGGILVAAGILAAVLLPRPWVATVGFGAVGAGLSTLYPSVLAAGGRLARRTNASSAATIAALSTLAMTGFLIGPPVIGLLAELLTLRGALASVGVAGVVVAVLAHSLGERAERVA